MIPIKENSYANDMFNVMVGKVSFRLYETTKRGTRVYKVRDTRLPDEEKYWYKFTVYSNKDIQYPYKDDYKNSDIIEFRFCEWNTNVMDNDKNVHTDKMSVPYFIKNYNKVMSRITSLCIEYYNEYLSKIAVI